MKNLIALLALVLIGLSTHAKQPDCKKFRNGKFKMTTELGVFYIERHGDTQYEYKEGETSKFKFKVKWISDCVYTLLPTEEFLKKFPDVPKDGVLTCTINEVKESSYIQTSTASFADVKKTSELVKIGD